MREARSYFESLRWQLFYPPRSGFVQQFVSATGRSATLPGCCQTLTLKTLQMTSCYIDHITITAPNLEVGAAFVQHTLGVMPQKGGEHPCMGTHNLLLRLGDALFLEVISPNPDAPRPDRARLFALDSLSADAQPRLATWVARTNDIQAVAAASSEALGQIEPMSRGALDWLITIPADGSLVLDGIAPSVIEWHGEPHPAAKLHDCGLSLVKLELFHPEPDRISVLLQSIKCQGPISVSPAGKGTSPYLVAHINTPKGLRMLSSPTVEGRACTTK